MHLLSTSIAASTSAAPEETKDVFYIFIQRWDPKQGLVTVVIIGEPGSVKSLHLWKSKNMGLLPSSLVITQFTPAEFVPLGVSKQSQLFHGNKWLHTGKDYTTQTKVAWLKAAEGPHIDKAKSHRPGQPVSVLPTKCRQGALPQQTWNG